MKKVQNSLLIGMFEKYSMFCDITIQKIKILIKLLTLFFSEWNTKEMQQAIGCPVASSVCFYGNTVSGAEYTSTQFRTNLCI